MKKLIAAVFVLVVFVGVGLAQVATPRAVPIPEAQGGTTLTNPLKAEPAPVLAEVDGLKIENALLKVQAAQVNLDKLKADFQGLLTSLTKPGYQLAQGADGKLTYVPEPKKEPK